MFQTSWWPSKCLQKNLKLVLCFFSACWPVFQLYFFFLNGMADRIGQRTYNVHTCKTIVWLVPQVRCGLVFLPNLSTQQQLAHCRRGATTFCSPLQFSFAITAGWWFHFPPPTVIFEANVCKTYPQYKDQGTDSRLGSAKMESQQDRTDNGPKMSFVPKTYQLLCSGKRALVSSYEQYGPGKTCFYAIFHKYMRCPRMS